MSYLTQTQIDKFKALGKAATSLSAKYKEGTGPDPSSGTTFSGGVPMCTWGQVLGEAGFKPPKNYYTSSNAQAFADFIGDITIATKKAVEVQDENPFSDVSSKQYDISKIHSLATKIMQANDPAPSASVRKEKTWQMLKELGELIEEEFGSINEQEESTWQTAAEQQIQNLIG